MALKGYCGLGCGAGAEEGVEHGVAGLGEEADEPLGQGQGEGCGVLLIVTLGCEMEDVGGG